MKNVRPAGRLIVIRHIGRVDHTEVLLSIIKLYIEDPELRSNQKSSARRGG
jgi:hypothetical protein